MLELKNITFKVDNLDGKGEIIMYTFLLLDLFTLIFGVDSRAVA